MAIRALVVEDDFGILRLVVAVLRDLGYEAHASSDAETALGMLEGTSFDIAVVDVRLPGMSGLELVQRIKARDASCRVLLVSAHGEPVNHRADGFLAKPFDIDHLVRFMQASHHP